MSNTLIATGAMIEAATVTTPSGIAASFPVTNLKLQQPGVRARWTSGLSTIDIILDLTASFAALGISGWRILPLTYHTLSSSATLDILEASTLTGLSVSPTTVASSLPPWRSSDWIRTAYPANTASGSLRRHTWYWTETPRTAAFVKVRINDSSNALGYVEIGGLPIDYGYLTTLPITAQPMASYAQEVRRTEALGGATLPQVTPVRFGLEFEPRVGGSGYTATSLNQEIIGNWLEIGRQRATSGSVFAVLDPASTAWTASQCVYGLLDAPPPVQLGDPWNLVSARFAVRAML